LRSCYCTVWLHLLMHWCQLSVSIYTHKSSFRRFERLASSFARVGKLLHQRLHVILLTLENSQDQTTLKTIRWLRCFSRTTLFLLKLTRKRFASVPSLLFPCCWGLSSSWPGVPLPPAIRTRFLTVVSRSKDLCSSRIVKGRQVYLMVAPAKNVLMAAMKKLALL
jgi:hypothetical protein